MNQKIYRQEALDRLSSPDQFDQLMPLTSPRGWVALAAAGLLLIVALSWAIFGTITVTVAGEGVFTRPGGVRTVTAPVTSSVQDVLVQADAKVKEGSALLVLEPRGSSSQKIVSPVDGRILAVSVRSGDVVKKGAALLTLEPHGAALEAVLFVPASEDAYLIRPESRVRVARGSGKGERGGGYVNGRVKSAARYPADTDTLLRVLQNDSWADQISRAGPVLQVVVELADVADRSNAEREPGEPALPTLYSGAPCHAHIVVDRMRPISLILPFFSR